MDGRSGGALRSRRALDVAVVGGGAIGLACAWRLAQRGLRTTVFDPHAQPPASEVAAGMLAPVTEAHYGEEALLQLNIASAALYPDFVAELERATGLQCGYRRCGTLVVARDRDDVEALEALAAYQSRLGLSVERVRGRRCRELEPALAPSVRGGIVVDSDHQIDPGALVRALAAAAAGAGADAVAAKVIAVERSGDDVSGVRLDDGRIVACAAAVIAAGAWSSLVAGAESLPPVRPVKGQLIRLGSPGSAPILGRNVRGLDVYLVPRADGRVVVGATVEERGYDLSITAGAVLELLRDAFELVPGIAELELTDAVAGLRPATADGGPVLGPAGPPGLVAATGHYRSGILLVPVTAEAVAAAVTGAEMPAAAAPFSPGRLALGGPVR